jgi:hypothetical protein
MRTCKIAVRNYNSSDQPHLKFVVNYREAGKRKRKFFETKAQASAFAAFKNEEMKRNGVEGALFPTSARVMAQNAIEKLKPFKGATITTAVDHYVAYLEASEKSCTAKQLVEELLADKEKRRGKAPLDGRRIKGTWQRHLGELRSRLKKFAEKFNGQVVAGHEGRD